MTVTAIRERGGGITPRERQKKQYQKRRERRHEQMRRKFLCVDCGKDTSAGEYYMVHNAIWAASGMKPNGGMLCLACLEKRIGRSLTLADFTAIAPTPIVWEAHLQKRLREKRSAWQSKFFDYDPKAC